MRIDVYYVKRMFNRLGGYVCLVTVSPKFQVVIPKDVRESIGLRAGEILQVIQYGTG